MNELLISLPSELLSHILIAIVLFAHISEGSLLLCDSHLCFVKVMIE